MDKRMEHALIFDSRLFKAAAVGRVASWIVKGRGACIRANQRSRGIGHHRGNARLAGRAGKGAGRRPQRIRDGRGHAPGGPGRDVAPAFSGCRFSAKNPRAPAAAVMTLTDPAVSEVLAGSRRQGRPRRPRDRGIHSLHGAGLRGTHPVPLRRAETWTGVDQPPGATPRPAGFLPAPCRSPASGAMRAGTSPWTSAEIYVRSGLLTQDTFSRLGGDMPQPPGAGGAQVPAARPDPASEAVAPGEEGQGP
jgi:hypothetical protein